MMSYGISNSPQTFQTLMGSVLRNLIGPEFWIFIDDVLMVSDIVQEHARSICHVLERFEKTNLRPQPSKCDFAKEKVIYRVIHKSLRDFRTLLRNNQDRHGRKEHINR